MKGVLITWRDMHIDISNLVRLDDMSLPSL